MLSSVSGKYCSSTNLPPSPSLLCTHRLPVCSSKCKVLAVRQYCLIAVSHCSKSANSSSHLMAVCALAHLISSSQKPSKIAPVLSLSVSKLSIRFKSSLYPSLCAASRSSEAFLYCELMSTHPATEDLVPRVCRWNVAAAIHRRIVTTSSSRLASTASASSRRNKAW